MRTIAGLPGTPVSPVSDIPFSRQNILWARARFRAALSALSPAQRFLFVARLRGTGTPAALARALDLTAAEAALALQQAMKQMREDLAERDEDEAWLERCRALAENDASVADLLPELPDTETPPPQPAAPEPTPDPVPDIPPVKEQAAPPATEPEPASPISAVPAWLADFKPKEATEQSLTLQTDFGFEIIVNPAISELQDDDEAAAGEETAAETVPEPKPTPAAPAAPPRSAAEPPQVVIPRPQPAPPKPVPKPAMPAPAPRPRPQVAATPERKPYWIIAFALIVLIAFAAWWLLRPSANDSAVPGPASTSTSPPPLPIPRTTDSTAPLDSADLPLLALELSEPGLLDELPMLIWLAEQGAPGAFAAAPSDEPAQDDGAVPEWSQLPVEQRRLLSVWSEAWPRLPNDARRQLAENAALWLALEEADRAALVKKVAEWDAEPAAARLAPRERFEAWRQIGPQGRAQVRAASDWLSVQPAERQQALLLQFSDLPPPQQAAFLRDAATRDAFDTVDAVFPFVPETERGETIALVRSLDPASRAKLREATRRMSPKDREALRRKLLELPPAQRAAAI